MANIETRIEKSRGCGYRVAGGKYLVSSGLGMRCGRLPVPCDVCPTCHAGLKPARGWTWIDLPPFLKDLPVCTTAGNCGACPLSSVSTIERAGLLWVGAKFYPAPADFTKEASDMGVSRRIHAIPNDFKLGETWVLFAHQKAIEETCTVCDGDYRQPELEEFCEHCDEGYQYKAGIFHAFQPSAIEYVVTGKETTEELDRMEKQGLTLVKVVKAEAQPPLFEEEVATAEGVH